MSDKMPEKIWDRLEKNASQVNMLVQVYKDIPQFTAKQTLEEMYHTAVDVAADLERLLNE